MKFVALLSLLLFCTISLRAQERLTKNFKVPNFVLTDAIGDKVNLQALLKENDKVLICFFRPVWCPICNKRTHELIERYDELKAKGIEVIAVYPTNREIMAQYVKDAKIPFPVLADPDEALYNLYSVERSMKKVIASIGRESFKKELVEGQELFHGKFYGAPKSKKDISTFINADFLVGTHRFLEVAYYGEYIGDHYDLDEL